MREPRVFNFLRGDRQKSWGEKETSAQRIPTRGCPEKPRPHPNPNKEGTRNCIRLPFGCFEGVRSAACAGIKESDLVVLVQGGDTYAEYKRRC